MGTKSKITKLIKELRKPESPAIRRGMAKPAGLYLLELRSHAARAQSSLAKRKLVITINPNAAGQDGRPQPIKITHT